MRRIAASAVLLVLNNEDIEGLLAAGAPADEYGTEAQMITQSLDGFPEHELSVERVTAIVADVCSRMFGPFDENELSRRLPGYRRVAKRIVDGP
jgi:hypothetical protein